MTADVLKLLHALAASVLGASVLTLLQLLFVTGKDIVST